MIRSEWPSGYPRPRALIMLGALGCALGTMMDGGLGGAQAGLAGGLCLAFVPLVAAGVARAARPDSLAGFVTRHIAARVVGQAARLLDALERRLALPARLVGMISRSLGPLADRFADRMDASLVCLARPLATPLGLANLAGASILAGSVAGISVFSFALVPGLIGLILALLVDESERRSGGFAE